MSRTVRAVTSVNCDRTIFSFGRRNVESPRGEWGSKRAAIFAWMRSGAGCFQREQRISRRWILCDVEYSVKVAVKVLVKAVEGWMWILWIRPRERGGYSRSLGKSQSHPRDILVGPPAASFNPFDSLLVQPSYQPLLSPMTPCEREGMKEGRVTPGRNGHTGKR